MTAQHSSSLNDFLSCPASYAIKERNEEAGAVSNPAMERGSLVHRAIEAYMVARVDRRNDAECERLARDILHAPENDLAIVLDAEPFLDAFFQTPLPEFEKAWVEWTFCFDAEWHLQARSVPDADTHYYGRVDFAYLDADGVLHVRDWKTAWRIRPDSELLDNIQLLGYAYAVREDCKDLGLQVTGVVLERHYILQKVLQSVVMDDESVNAIPDTLTTIIQRVEAEVEFLPRPSTDRCPTCTVRQFCLAYKNAGLSQIEPKSEGDWARMAEEYVLLKAKVGDYEDLLKERINAVGKVALQDGRFMEFSTVHKRKPRPDVVSILRRYDYTEAEILDIATLSVGGIAKMIKKHPKKAEIEEQAFEEKAESHLHIGKPGVE